MEQFLSLSRSPLQIDLVGAVPFIVLAIIILIILGQSIRIIREYERVVVFRLGRLLSRPDGTPYAKGPGVIFLVPLVDRPRIVDLRLLTFDVPKQRIITKDNVTVDVDAVVYFRVADAISAIVIVRDFVLASNLLAQTTLRDVIGQTEFDELLTKRDELNKKLQHILDEATDAWGIKVTAVNIKDVVIPESMQRAIAKQAEAERERRSRIIMADGEFQAATKMLEAAKFYAESPSALRLRELQTWTEIARERNMIIVTEGSAAGLGSLIGVAKEVSKPQKSQ